jgi:glutathione S-transferase
MSGKAVLYFTKASMPSRAVLLGIRSLNIDVEVKNVNLIASEQKNEEFLKINPVEKVPVFVDTDGFTLYESRAILAYLVNSRKPGSDLYPSDVKKRALIDQRLYFDK